MNSNRIITIEGFLTTDECTSFVDAIEAIGFENQYAGDGRLIRSRAQFEDHDWAKLIWERLKPSLPKLTEIYSDGLSPEPAPAKPLETYAPISLNERFRCYKYGTDEEFRRHQDFAHEYTETKRTFLTVLIYLNDGYEGGETSFDDFVVNPKLGMLAMFPHELEHEGRKIASGLKYSLRTDAVYESIGG
jgi:prolyl 4-hydroxylase